MRKTGRFEKKRQNEKRCKKKRKGKFFTNINFRIFGIKKRVDFKIRKKRQIGKRVDLKKKRQMTILQ